MNDRNLIKEFIAAYDAWVADEEYGMGGVRFDAMLKARQELQDAQDQSQINSDEVIEVEDAGRPIAATG